MIRGYFSPVHPAIAQPYNPKHPPVPLVDAVVWVPELGSNSAIAVTFLVDTGADMTVLHPQDSLRLLPTEDAWKWAMKKASAMVGGAGQGVRHYMMDAWILFTHTDGTVDSRNIVLCVGHPHPGNRQHESLLGRDVLQHYVSSFDGVYGLTLAARPPAP